MSPHPTYSQACVCLKQKEFHITTTTTSLRFDKLLQGKRSANNHNDHGQHQLPQIQIRNRRARLVSKEHDMHNGGEGERGQHIREVSDQSHHRSERRNQQRDQRHQTHLHRAQHDILRRLDEDLAVLDVVALHGLVHRLHPQRKAAHHRHHHREVDDHAQRAVGRERVQDVVLHAWETGKRRTLPTVL